MLIEAFAYACRGTRPRLSFGSAGDPSHRASRARQHESKTLEDTRRYRPERASKMPSQNGNGGRGGPWGVRGGPSPDLEELLRQGQDHLKRMMMPGGGPSGLKIILIFGLLLAGFGVWSAFYTVPSDSVAVVQRFGKYLKEVQPGLNFKLPLGRRRRHDRPGQAPVEAGVWVCHSGERKRPGTGWPSRQAPESVAQMVTGDLNAALVEWVVQYRISEPISSSSTCGAEGDSQRRLGVRHAGGGRGQNGR